MSVYRQRRFEKAFRRRIERPRVIFEIGHLHRAVFRVEIDRQDLLCGGGKRILGRADGYEHRRILIYGQRLPRCCVDDVSEESFGDGSVCLIGEALRPGDFLHQGYNAGKIETDSFEYDGRIVDRRLVVGGQRVVVGGDRLHDAHDEFALVDGLFFGVGLEHGVEAEENCGDLRRRDVLHQVDERFVRGECGRDEQMRAAQSVASVYVPRADQPLAQIGRCLYQHCVVGDVCIDSFENIAELVDVVRHIVEGRAFERAFEQGGEVFGEDRLYYVVGERRDLDDAFAVVAGDVGDRVDQLGRDIDRVVGGEQLICHAGGGQHAVFVGRNVLFEQLSHLGVIRKERFYFVERFKQPVARAHQVKKSEVQHKIYVFAPVGICAFDEQGSQHREDGRKPFRRQDLRRIIYGVDELQYTILAEERVDQVGNGRLVVRRRRQGGGYRVQYRRVVRDDLVDESGQTFCTNAGGLYERIKRLNGAFDVGGRYIEI